MNRSLTTLEHPLLNTSNEAAQVSCIDKDWQQVGNDLAGDYDISVALSSDGKTVVIGFPYNHYSYYDDGYYNSYGDEDSENIGSGYAQVYRNVNDNWTQLGTDIYGEARNDEFGSSVSISADGNTVAVGAIGNDGNGEGINYGHVRVYRYVDGSWTQIGSDIDGEASYDSSGWSVSLSSDGNTVAIGAPFNDGNGDDENGGSGHVRVYGYVDGSWIQIGGDIDGEYKGHTRCPLKPTVASKPPSPLFTWARFNTKPS